MKLIVVIACFFAVASGTGGDAIAPAAAGLRQVGVFEGVGDIGALASYWLSETNKSWTDANRDCKQNNGALIAPSSSELNEILRLILEENGVGPTTPVWTDGCFDTSPPPAWGWTTSRRVFKDVDADNWASGHPGRSDGTRCMAAMGTGRGYKWYNFSKRDKFYYVCVNQS